MRGWWRPAAGFGGAVLGIGVGLLIVAASGESPLAALEILLRESLGSIRALGRSAENTTPLLLAGLGITVGLRAGLFNIGGEGQLALAALAANMVAVAIGASSAWLSLPIVFLAGTTAGAIWGGLAGVLRAYRGVSEIVSTIMLNFVALGLIAYLVRGPLLAPGAAFPQTRSVPDALGLPEWGALDLGGLIGITLALVLWLGLHRTQAGIRLQGVGRNADAARAAHIPVARFQALALAASGMVVGLAGIVELLATQHKVSPGFSPGYGFVGLLVAFLGGAHPLAVIPAAFFMGILETGGPALTRQLGIPDATILTMQAIAALTAVGLPHALHLAHGRVRTHGHA